MQFRCSINSALIALFVTFASFFFVADSRAVKSASISKGNTFIDESYFLTIELDGNNCAQSIVEECFRRDSHMEEPYHHKTFLSIFQNKFFVQQFFQEKQSKTNKSSFTSPQIVRLRDGKYKFYTTNKNLIGFKIQKGGLSDLKLFSGDLSRERKSLAKKKDIDDKADCDYAIINYGHSKRREDFESLFFTEEKFDGIKELEISSEQQESKRFVVLRDENYGFIAPKDMTLCKNNQDEQWFVYPRLDSLSCGYDEQNNVSNGGMCSQYQECSMVAKIKNCLFTYEDKNKPTKSNN